jgi:FkbM family methyltransferase
MRKSFKNSEDESSSVAGASFIKWCALLCLAGILYAQMSLGSFMKGFYGSIEASTKLASGLPISKSRQVHQQTNAHLCPKKDAVEMRRNSSKSQSKEDEMLLKWFNGLCNGTYVEMGALDGILYSNSYLFHKELGWSGVLVELEPTDYEKLKVNRPTDMTVHAAVCNERKTIHYLTNHRGKGGSAVDGIYEFMPQSFRDQWWHGISLESGSDKVVEVECIPMSDILAKSPYTHFDFYSLDVEGAEYEVLQSIDFEKYSFGIMLVEADGHNPRKNLVIRTFLESKGYTFLMDHQRSYWFVNQDFPKIYHDLLHA